MAAREAGVDHLLVVLRQDYVRTRKLLGVTNTADLSRDLVTLERPA
jgi:hypothetical protein